MYIHLLHSWKTVGPEEVIPFIEALNIRKFHGVGKVTAEKMYQKGIFTGKDLKERSLEYLNENFGKTGLYYYNIVRGVHTSEVKPNRIRKSLAAERTFSQNLSSEIFMLEKLDHIITCWYMGPKWEVREIFICHCRPPSRWLVSDRGAGNRLHEPPQVPAPVSERVLQSAVH